MQLHGPGSGDAATWLLGNGATHSCPGRRLGRLPDNPSPGQPLPVGSEGLPSLALVRGVPERPPLSPCRWRFLWNRAVSWVPRTWTQPWAQLCLWVLCAEAPFLPGGHRPSPGAWKGRQVLGGLVTQDGVWESTEEVGESPACGRMEGTGHPHKRNSLIVSSFYCFSPYYKNYLFLIRKERKQRKHEKEKI